MKHLAAILIALATTPTLAQNPSPEDFRICSRQVAMGEAMMLARQNGVPITKALGDSPSKLNDPDLATRLISTLAVRLAMEAYSRPRLESEIYRQEYIKEHGTWAFYDCLEVLKDPLYDGI